MHCNRTLLKSSLLGPFYERSKSNRVSPAPGALCIVCAAFPATLLQCFTFVEIFNPHPTKQHFVVLALLLLSIFAY